MMKIKETKALSKEIIKKNKILFKFWLILATSTFIITLIVNIIDKFIVSNNPDNFINSIAYLYYLKPVIKGLITSLFVTPFLIGYIHSMIRIINKKNVVFSDVYRFYKTPHLYLKTMVINIIIITISNLMTATVNYLSKIILGVNVTYIIFPLLLIIITIILYSFLFIANYIYVSSPALSIIEIFKKSFVIMSRNILNYYLFLLSFISWWVLNLIIFEIVIIAFRISQGTYIFFIISGIFGNFMFGIGFYFLPYYNLSLAIFANNLIMEIQ